MARFAGCALSAAVALFAGAAVAAAAVGPADPTVPAAAAPVGSARLLDVPYLPQTEDLCGGAAVAMVLRYWGERQVYAEDFADLVDRSRSGIPTDVLAAAMGRRGWQAFPFSTAASASGESIRQHVDRGRPIVALIQVRPDRYHYVVIVAWTGDQVILHDPARAPFRVMSRAEFDRAAAPAGHWALLLLPADEPKSALETAPDSLAMDTGRTASACAALVRKMVDHSGTGDLGGAETGLLAAVQLCPRDPAAWRGLAGIRFLQSHWDEASIFAERAARLDPDDEQGWNLLATSRFLNDQPDAALDAWNRIVRPSVDLVRVEGARRTRHPVIAALVDLPPRTLLTAEKHRLAARRLDELPIASSTRLRYRPIDGGFAEIEAAIVERPTVPRGVVPLAAAAARAWLQRELRVDVAGPLGGGELWTAAWRWEEARPRLAFAVVVPTFSWLPGITTIEGSWERPSFATGSAQAGTAAIQRDERRRAAMNVTDWATSHLRWKAGAALDRWAENSHLSVDAALDLRLANDRLSIGLDTAAWVPTGAGARFARASVSSAWRSTPDTGRPAWLAHGGFAATTAAAPFALWPGAGTGHGRTPLLRAHPLLEAGVISGPVFGRGLMHGTLEYQHPLLTVQRTTLRFAAFTDLASASRRVSDDDRLSRHVDAGVGIRLALPGSGGTMRVDVARGLRDRRVVLSAGWQAPWPGH